MYIYKRVNQKGWIYHFELSLRSNCKSKADLYIQSDSIAYRQQNTHICILNSQCASYGLGKRQRVLENKLLYTQNLTRICAEALHGNKMMEVQRYTFSVLICEGHSYTGLSLGSGGRGTCSLKGWSDKTKGNRKHALLFKWGWRDVGACCITFWLKWLSVSQTRTQFCTYWDSHHHRTGLRTSQQPDKVGTFHSLQALCSTGSKHKKVQKNAFFYSFFYSWLV